MKKCLTWLGASAAAIAMLSGSALAEDAPTGPTVSFNAAVTTDYVFRGLSQTGGHSAAQGGADLTYGLIYAGVWLSNVDFGPTVGDPSNKTTMEYDLYGGVRPTVGPVTLDLGFIRYGYTDSPAAANYEYWEGKIGASHTEGPLTVGGTVYISPQFYGKTGTAEYFELNAAYNLKNKVSVSGAVGHQNLDEEKAGIDGYTTWNVGFGYPITDHFAIDLRYYGTNSAASHFYTKTFAGDRLVATLKATF